MTILSCAEHRNVPVLMKECKKQVHFQRESYWQGSREQALLAMYWAAFLSFNLADRPSVLI